MTYFDDPRFEVACQHLAGRTGLPAKRVAEAAWIGITGQAQAGVIGLGVPLVGMTQPERLEYFIERAMAGAE